MKEKMADIHKSAGILIHDRKFLVTRSKGKTVFYSPGGKIEKDETPEEALIRELQEELRITVDPNDLHPFGSFTALATGQDDRTIYMEVFTVSKWTGMPVASSEIEEIAWIDSTVVGKMELGSIFEHEVLPRLKEKNFID